MSKTKAGPIRADHLKSIVDRYERLGEERDAVSGDMRDVLAEAKGVGYDRATIRWLVKERKIDVAARDERDQLRDAYAHALGMALNLVEVEGMSLRQAAKRAGVSKSSVHRALAVPEPSQPAGSSVGEDASNPDATGRLPGDEGEDDARSSNQHGESGRIVRASGGGSSPEHRDGKPVRNDGRQSASTEQHAGRDRGTAGAIRAAARVDDAREESGNAGPDAGHLGRPALDRELDGHAPQPPGRDLHEAGRASVVDAGRGVDAPSTPQEPAPGTESDDLEIPIFLRRPVPLRFTPQGQDGEGPRA